MPVLTRSARRLSRPTLPTELIDQILNDPQLEKSDLARCCRINRNFLSSAQHLLYRNVEILFFTTDIENGGQWSLNEPSARFFDCLSADPTISRHVRTITVTGEYSPMLESEETSSSSESDSEDGSETGSEEASSSEDTDYDPAEAAKEYYGVYGGGLIDCPQRGAEVFREGVDAVEFCIRMLPHLEVLIGQQDWDYGGLTEGEGSEWRILNEELAGRCGETPVYRLIRRAPDT